MFLKKLASYEPFVAVSDVFMPDEIARIRSLIEGQETTPGKIGADKPTEVRSVRSSQIRRISSAGEHKWIFERLAYAIEQTNPKVFGLDLDYIEEIQLTEYDAAYSGFYGQHMDAAYGSVSIAQRKLSISVQLSAPDEYEGGDLILYPNGIHRPDTAPRDLGAVILFRSHIVHEVLPVTSGKRYSLVAWVRGPLPR